MAMRFFVTGTDTGVGKTEVAVALLQVMVERGMAPFAFKPYESGGNADAKRLFDAAGSAQPAGLYTFKTPVAPAVAARLEGKRTSWAQVLARYRRLAANNRAGIVEGAGGLFVPLDSKHLVIDLIEALQLPVLLVARAGLGTINHTALSIEALRHRRLSVAFVVLNATSKKPDASLQHNRRELERLYPSVNFIGPMPFVAGKQRRQASMRKALSVPPLFVRSG